MKKTLGLAAAILGLASSSAFATPVFNPTFTAAFDTEFNAHLAGSAVAAHAAWISAAASLASYYTDNITINITVDAVAGTGTLGQSSTPLNSITYTSLYNALLTDATTADDATATGLGGSYGGNGTSGSAASPLGAGEGTSYRFWATRAQQKALGLLGASGTSDGTVTFGAGHNYTFSGVIAGGTYDFQAVVMHEISEVMGRIGLSGGTLSGLPAYTALDALSYTAPGTRNLLSGTASFSLNAGTTLLKAFNALGSGDTRDWASGTNDAFNAFSSIGVSNPLSAVDLRVMDAIGYNFSSPVPEPATMGLLAVGLLGLGFARRRRA